ncbi:hypothetical protein JZ751_016190, partial [Albula glossodonta]
PTQGIIQPTQGLIQPTQGLIQPTQGLLQPTQGLIQPTQGLIQPTQGIIQPGSCARKVSKKAMKLKTAIRLLQILAIASLISPGLGPGLSQTFKCSGPMEGRYVNVYIPRREYLTLCEVEVNGEEADDGNVALRKEATQSDTAYGGPASLAVDGNRSPVYGQKSCTHTSNRANPWWRVDLLKPHRIFSVTITNRKDCCASRINGAQIRIGNSLENNGNNNPLCSTVPSIGPGLSQTFKCSGPMEGRYVNVYIPRREYLTLCEVEVNGEEADDGNVALRKEATQSDTAYGGPASLAVDGNRSPVYGQKSCTHTSNRANPWWRVDLLKPHRIFSVTITNRKDCCASRINGAQIRIGNSLENNGNNNPLRRRPVLRGNRCRICFANEVNQMRIMEVQYLGVWF